jgi:hypothetical protein
MTQRPLSRSPLSDAEVLLAVQLEQAGIPFEREYRFHPSRKWRADFAIVHPDATRPRLPGFYTHLIEVDGGSWVAGRHTRGSGFEKDAEKLNAAAELGYRVLRYTPRMIEDGSAIEQIRRILSMKEARKVTPRDVTTPNPVAPPRPTEEHETEQELRRLRIIVPILERMHPATLRWLVKRLEGTS